MAIGDTAYGNAAFTTGVTVTRLDGDMSIRGFMSHDTLGSWRLISEAIVGTGGFMSSDALRSGRLWISEGE